MRFDIQERDEAIAALIAVVGEIGPVEPHVLIDTAASRVNFSKSTVLAGWLHLLAERILYWQPDGKVRVMDETEQPQHVRAKDEILRYMAEHGRPVAEEDMISELSRDAGLDEATLYRTISTLISDDFLSFHYGEDDANLKQGPAMQHSALASS